MIDTQDTARTCALPLLWLLLVSISAAGCSAAEDLGSVGAAVNTDGVAFAPTPGQDVEAEGPDANLTPWGPDAEPGPDPGSFGAPC